MEKVLAFQSVGLRSARKASSAVGLIALFVIGSSTVVRAGEFDVPVGVNQTVRHLQGKLAKHAIDDLLESKRIERGWELKFRIGHEKTQISEVNIVVRSSSAYEAHVTVVVRVTKFGLFHNRQLEDAEASASWTEEIQKLLSSRV